MANMFSGNTTKTVPATLDECIRIDAVSKNLWTWSERLERWGKILFFILIIIGLIATFETASKTQELLNEVYNQVDRIELAKAGVEIPSVFDVVVDSLLKWGLYAFLEYCAYHVLALLIGALASITQNTIITANVALYQSNSAPISTPESAPKSVFSGKPTVSYSQIVNRTPAPDGMWACIHCGTHNKNEYGQCKRCGQYRS